MTETNTKALTQSILDKKADCVLLGLEPLTLLISLPDFLLLCNELDSKVEEGGLLSHVLDLNIVVTPSMVPMQVLPGTDQVFLKTAEVVEVNKL